MINIDYKTYYFYSFEPYGPDDAEADRFHHDQGPDGGLNDTGYLRFDLPSDSIEEVEVFTTLTEAKVLIEQWRREYNEVRPHSSLGYQPPAPEARMLVTLT